MDPANTRLSSLLLLISLMLPVLAFGQVAKKVAQASFPSVVLVVMEDGRGHPLGLASGFFVNRDIIATNAHVIQGASRAYARRIGDKIKYDVRSIVALDEARDLALLQLEKATGTPLTLGDSDRLAVGDEVFAVGNPQGLEGTFSQGIVSGVRAVKGMSLLQITAPISPGSSGGPVLNAQAEVIGVAVATFRDGQNLNFAVPAKYLMALMSEPANPRSLQSYEKASGSRALLNDLGGEKDTEGVEGTNFRWDSDSGVFSFS